MSAKTMKLMNDNPLARWSVLILVALMMFKSRLKMFSSTQQDWLYTKLTAQSDIRLIATPNSDGGWARAIIAPECASLKQWLHWLFLMLLFPGPWKHKLWYIPAGLVIVEWTNVVRICGVLMMQIPWPNSFHIAHDYIFKVFFYLIIFLMWVIWVECFKNKTKESHSQQTT